MWKGINPVRATIAIGIMGVALYVLAKLAVNDVPEALTALVGLAGLAAGYYLGRESDNSQ